MFIFDLDFISLKIDNSLLIYRNDKGEKFDR